ncbi:MAG TPA: dolichyl-phosphate beta-glucosyltransferase [Actinomycetes bacterium]
MLVDQRGGGGGGGERPTVEVVVPVHDEEMDLGPSVCRLHEYLSGSFPFSFRITIADNASSDGTWPLAQLLARELDHVRAVRLEEKGRGRALRAVWGSSDAAVLAYMDVDLSTGLEALLPLVAPLVSGHSDVAIGSRLRRGARVVRGAKREVISRCYNLLLHATLGTRFSDAQCGFKAIRADAARALLPLVVDGGWFFDTELLVLAERSGLRIHEVPVDWVDDPDSRVDLVATPLADLRGVARLGADLAGGRIPVAMVGARLGRAGPPPAGGGPAGPGTVRQVARFALVGVASTLAYLGLYAALRNLLAAQAANAAALLATAVANTSANRRFTFAVRGAARAVRHQLQGLGVFALALALTAGALAGLQAAVPRPGRTLELAVLVAANLAATVVRFLLLRDWVFRPSRRRTTTPAAPAAARAPAEPRPPIALTRSTR